MATLDELKTKYFVTSSDLPAGSRVPTMRDGSVVSQLVDGKDFFAAVYAAINSLTGSTVSAGGKTYHDFVYIANWNLLATLPLPDPRIPGVDDLATLLAKKGEQGVDVRVLIWFGASTVPYLYVPAYQWSSTIAGLFHAHGRDQEGITIVNLWTAMQLRLRLALHNSVLLDYGGHPLGAHHMKVIAVYDATLDRIRAFCGGMDLERSRGGEVYHENEVGDAMGSSLDPPGVLPAPTLSDGGPGNLPAGTFDVRYAAVAGRVDPKHRPPPTRAVSSWAASPPLAAKKSIHATGLPVLPPGSDYTRSFYARKSGDLDLPRLVPPRLEDDGSSTEFLLDADSSTWGEELTRWEWHDVAVQLDGAAAIDVAEVIRLRWNATRNYNPLQLDLTSIANFQWIGAANGVPVGMMPPPTVTSATGGSLPVGDYAVCYTITAAKPATAGTTLFGVSNIGRVTVPTGSKITASGLLASIPKVLNEPSSAVFVTQKREMWAWREGVDPTPRLVGAVPTAATTFDINGDPTSWPASFPNWTIDELATTTDRLRTIPASVGQQSAQVLLTIAPITSSWQTLWATARPYPFAPTGEFTTYYAYKKAIAAASTYIYAEDQVGFGTELMKLIAARVKAKPDLKVILVTSGMFDPADGDIAFIVGNIWNVGVWKILIEPLSAASRANVRFCRSRGLTTHSKILLIDDEWTAVGSANALNRSFSTDTEMSVGVVDASGQFVKNLRKTLWAEHLNIHAAHASYAALDDPVKALQLWMDPSHAPVPPPGLRRAADISLPVKVKSLGLTDVTDRARLMLFDYATESF